MVGIFSRFSVRGNNHRRAQSALDRRGELPRISAATNTCTVASTASTVANHGIEISVEFKPIEHPNEPLDNDRPVQCPLPEPSILNDGRIWKERVSSSVQPRADMPVMQEEQTSFKPETPRTKPRPPKRAIMPSVSAPEHNILKLLEECNESGMSFST